MGFEFVGVGERKTRGGYRFMKLMKFKKKEKIYAVFYFAGKRKTFFYIYEIFTSQEKEKRSVTHY